MTTGDADFAHARPDASSARGSWLSGLLWLLGGAMAWAVLATAAWLRADGRGFGTHEQLGLPPCAFSAATHLPCPGCGLTTSFTHMAHGHFVRAFVAHPMGPLLFVLTAVVALYAPFALARRRTVLSLFESTPMVSALALTAATGVVTWALRLVHALPWR